MMKKLYLIVFVVFAATQSQPAKQYHYDNLHDKKKSMFQKECKVYGIIDEFCDSDGSGFLTCDDNNGNVLKNIKCSIKPNTKCQCYNDYEYNDQCECVDPTPRPLFPKTGTLRWSGTDSYSDDWYWDGSDQYRSVKVTGSVRRTSDGSFLKNSINVRWIWDTQEGMVAKITKDDMMILRSSNGIFTKYMRKDGENCTNEPWTGKEEEKTLSFIWKDDGNVKHNLISQRPKKYSDGITIQTWKQFYQGDSWDKSSTWKIAYNKKKRTAIPISWEFSVNDGFDFSYRRTIHNFDYTPLTWNDYQEFSNFCY